MGPLLLYIFDSVINHYGETLIYAFFVGLLPAAIWLWFWLHEDSAHPEPRSILTLTFTTGMAMIFLAIPLEAIFMKCVPGGGIACPPIGFPLMQPWQFLAWASVEEILKFAAVFIAALHTKAYDEPIDAIIYMMCAALGFAALENMLFILNNTTAMTPNVLGTGFLSTVFLTNLRFIGANLLHVVASSTIGIALALSFYKSKGEKIVWAFGGLCAAIILHWLFNLFIIYRSDGIFLVFATVWLVMIGFLLIFEKIKKMRMLVTTPINQR